MMPKLALAALVLLAQLQSPPPAQDPVTEIRGLVQAKLWAQVDARLDALAVDDPAWERLAPVVYTAAVARQDLPAAIVRLTRVATSTTKPSNKAAALITIGRAHRRQGDRAAAVRAWHDAKTAAPGTPFAEDAEGLIYEVERLSPGLPAPPISAKARNGRSISLAQLRGKPVVLVFWGTT
jgi:hypothetical protein